MNRSIRFPIEDKSHIGEVRRHVSAWSLEANLDETTAGQISIVINELGTNILKHATRGEMICTQNNRNIEILAIDKGPGIMDPRSFQDGFSTQGTAGNGLGAVKRLSTEMDVFTMPGKGTIILASFETHKTQDQFKCSGISIPLKGEEVCGDSWTCSLDDKFHLMVADGLGHGLLAFDASQAAVNEFNQSKHDNPLHDITIIHGRLRSTRGAAVSVASVDREKNIIDYAGIGNISGSVVTRNSNKKMISYNGTAGVQMRTVKTLSYPWDKDSIMILHSDGLSTQWNLNDYPGIYFRHPAVICGILYRDFARGTDDVTVVAVKEVE